MKDFFKKNQKMIIKGAIAFLIMYLIYKNWWRISALLRPKSKNISPDGQEGLGISDARKGYIEGLAGEMYTDIYSTPFTGHDYEPYQSAKGLFDDEIVYLADFYKNHLASGNSLYNDINSQWYTWGDSPTDLMNLLAANGKKD